jgi:hypothetical protein
MDSDFSLYEIIRHIHVKKQVGIILKLYFKKAYDKVNWDFLTIYHEARGFYFLWCSWVRRSVKINNKVGPYFQSAKGVRLGTQWHRGWVLRRVVVLLAHQSLNPRFDIYVSHKGEIFIQ